MIKPITNNILQLAMKEVAKDVRKPKCIRDGLVKEPLYDNNSYITRDIGFELTFGFKDTTDTIMYKESSGLDPISLPKEKPIKF